MFSNVEKSIKWSTLSNVSWDIVLSNKKFNIFSESNLLLLSIKKFSAYI